MAEYEKDDPARKDLDPNSDAAILAEILADYDYDTTNWKPIREQAAIDVAYASNDTWTEDDKKVRGSRLMLNLDQLSQYRNQIENTVRQNKRGVKVSPAGAGATDKTAELRANRIREIEYQSHAQEAYSQAFSDCLTRGFGFARVVAEYEDEETDNQVIRTKAIPNPSQCLPDTDGQSTSGRDWKRFVFLDSISHAQFRRDYPDALVRDFDPDVIAGAPKGWISSTRVQIAECWRVRETPNPKGYGRPKREVCMYLTNGIELLAKKGHPKKTVWKGKYIPFAACLGRIVYKDGAAGSTEKQILSYIRFARDAAKGYNWTKSTILEKLALPVKASLFAYEGQLDQDQVTLVQRATQEHIPLITAKATLEGVPAGTVLPLPQYGTREPEIQADMVAAEGFARDVQNALGHFNVIDGRLGSTKVTSGVALQEQKRAGDLGSFDFQDHYDDFLKFLGEQYDDLLPHYDDAVKEIATRLPDDSVKMVAINQMTGRAPNGEPAFAPDDARIDLGRHTISISTGPSSDTQRDAGKDAAMTLLANPTAFPVIAADAVRLLDLGPVGDQMAEDLEFLQPPVMQQARAQKQEGGAPDPRMLQQKIAQLEQQLQHAEAVMQQQHGELEGKQAEIASKEKIAQMEIASKEKIAALDRETKITVAELSAKVERIELFMEERARVGAHISEAAAQASDQLHEHVQADLTREHAAGQAALARRHDVGMAAAGAGADAAAQAAGHDQAMAQARQAAELAPQPSNNGAGA